MNSSRQKKQHGFSLLEILVAFSILSLSLGILLNIFSSGVRTAVLSEDYTAAVQIAESLLARTGVENELLEGELSGEEYEKYNWTISSYPYEVYEQHNLEPPENSAGKKDKLKVFQVIVTVAWSEGEGDENERTVQLNTLKYSFN